MVDGPINVKMNIRQRYQSIAEQDGLRIRLRNVTQGELTTALAVYQETLKLEKEMKKQLKKDLRGGY
jgi:hypothetical protein